MSIDKKMSEVLGIEPPVKQSTEVTVNATTTITEIHKEEIGSDDRDSDYNLSRNVFRNLIHSGVSSLEHMTELAKESESPRAYEVLATLINTISATTKDLYDIHKKKKDLLEDKSKSTTDNINVERAVFVGSTAELLAKIKNNNKSE